MDKKQKALKILSDYTNSNWKIGKSDFDINSISARVSALPTGVFDYFYINTEEKKQISTVDFALMTYDMSEENRLSLMHTYGIKPSDVEAIYSAMNDIADILDQHQEIE